MAPWIGNPRGFFFMRGRLTELAKRDISRITSDTNGWGQNLVMIAPTGETASVSGLHSKHHLGFDAELQKFANTKSAHISVSEQFLVALGYPVRDASGEVAFRNHLVQTVDSTGVQWTYQIIQWFPDETIGMILCILADYDSSEDNTRYFDDYFDDSFS